MLPIEDIDQDTFLWLQKAYQKGRDIIQWYNKEIKQQITLSDLDEVFVKWDADHSDNRAPNDWVIDGLGALFGKYIIEQTHGKWAIEKDSEEKHLIVLTLNGIKAYPIHSVSKRVNGIRGDINFFSNIMLIVQENNARG